MLVHVRKLKFQIQTRSSSISVMFDDNRTAMEPMSIRLHYFCLLRRHILTSGVFDAEVHPDLPPARKTAELITYYAQRAKEGVLGARPSAEGDSAAATLSSQRTSSGSGRRRVRDGEGYLVRSVPVQTSSREVRYSEWLGAVLMV